MDSLSAELLSRIFINVLPPHLDDARYPVDDPAPVQASVCCVCQKWNRAAKSTPGFWTFIKISPGASSHDVMKRRLELAGNSPLNVAMQFYLEGGEGSSPEVYELLLERVSQWKTLRVEATIWEPSQLQQWIPDELPNVASLHLKLEILDPIEEDDEDSRAPFISAPRLTFCSSDSPVWFPLAHCPLLQEYHVSGIGYGERGEPPRALEWSDFVTFLSEKCPRLEVLEVFNGSEIWPSVNEDPPEDWPTLTSLTTLRFTNGSSYMNIRCLLTRLKAPLLHLVEFQGVPTSDGSKDTNLSIAKVPFLVNNDGRIRFSGMSISDLIAVVGRISDVPDLRVEVDVASIIVGSSRTGEPASETLEFSSTAVLELRSRWEWVGQNLPKVSWVVPSDEGEGRLKRLGGADLIFDDALAYLKNRMRLQHKA
ncbi:hypothetical protein FRC01_010068 [Tulasnella sp. 417]|nr:hypothetical protein FRC01_010068 [Tulasnella sp. 417]